MADAAEIEELKRDLEEAEESLEWAKKEVKRCQREGNNELMSFWIGGVEAKNKSVAVIKKELVEAGVDIEREGRLKAERGRFIGGFKYAAEEGKKRILGAGENIRNVPTLAKEAVIKKAKEARENVWPIAGQAAKGAVVGAGKTLVGAGKAVAGTGRFIKGIESWFSGEESGSFSWLIWVGLILHIIKWQIFDFQTNPTLANLDVLILGVILIKHYGLFSRFDKRKIAAIFLAIIVYQYVPNIVTQYGSLYIWFMFPLVMMLSRPSIAIIFFLQFNGTILIGNLFPQLLATPFAWFFDLRFWPWWMLLGAFKGESIAARRIAWAYGIFLIFYVIGFSGQTAYAAQLTFGQGSEEVRAAAEERVDAMLERNKFFATIWERGKLCFTEDTTQCARIFAGPDKKEEEDELTRGGIDRSMEQKVTMRWSTEPPDTISVGEEASSSAILYVTSTKGLIMDVECGISGKKDSGTAKPNQLQIERRRAGEEKTVICKFEKQSLLKEGRNTILFNAKVLGSQLDVSSWYVFYAMNGNWFERQEEELLSKREVKEAYDLNVKTLGPSTAKLRLYEQRLLPGLIENMVDKIKRRYEIYPSGKIESKSEPSFIKIKMSINNDVPFVGIERGTELTFRMSVENTVANGKIIDINSGYVEMPAWLEPKQDECDFLDKSTRRNVNNRNRYNIAKNTLKIDWSVYDFGFSKRKKFEPCALVVNKRSEEIEGFELFDLNEVLINSSLKYDFGVETKTTLNIEKGALAEIYLGDLDSFPVNKNANPTFEDDFGAPRDEGKHKGIDILAPLGTNIIAAKSGIILKIGCNELGGNRIGILDNNGDYFYYAHLDTFTENLKVDDEVTAGNVLGTTGDTKGCNETCTGGDDLLCGIKGEAPPAHLHFGIYRGGEAGTALNPFSALERLG